MLHRAGGDLVREPHSLDLLLRLDRACLRRSGVASIAWERVEPCLRIGRRLADHAIRTLRAERELERRHLRRRKRSGARGQRRNPGGRGSVPRGNPGRDEVRRPARALGVICEGLEADQDRIVFARERKASWPSSPEAVEVREHDVRAHGRRTRRVLLGRGRAHALELCVIPRPGVEPSSTRGRVPFLCEYDASAPFGTANA